MRYTGSVSNAFVQSMAHNFEQALRLMDAALTDCPDHLWQTDLWPDEAPTGPTPHGGLHGSAPWFLGYHALLTLDYDLAAEFEPWAPPQPFDDNTFAFPNRRFTKPELLGYVDWCRGRVRQTLDGLTEEMAARPLPSAHRYHGMLFAVIVGSMPLHVVEHASQIRQFLTAAGVTVQAHARRPWVHGLTVMVLRRMLTGDPGDLTQLAEAVGPELSLAPVAIPVRCRGSMSGRLPCHGRQPWWASRTMPSRACLNGLTCAGDGAALGKEKPWQPSLAPTTCRERSSSTRTCVAPGSAGLTCPAS